MNPDTGLPLPDITVYLTLRPEVAAQRGAYGDERYEKLEVQAKVREQFGLVAAEVQKRHGEVWAEVSAEGTVEEVGEEIWKVVQPRLEVGELGRLWV